MQNGTRHKQAFGAVRGLRRSWIGAWRGAVHCVWGTAGGPGTGDMGGCRARQGDRAADTAGGRSDGEATGWWSGGGGARHFVLAQQFLLAGPDALQGAQVDQDMDQGILVGDGTLAPQVRSLDA